MIRRFTAVFRFEMSKALAAKATWVTIILPALVAGLAALGSNAVGDSEAMLGLGGDATPSAFLGFARGTSSGLMLGGILILLYSSLLFSNEGGWGTYKTIMLRPHRRFEWVAAKFLLLVCMVATLMTSVSLTSFIVSGIFGDYTDIAEEGYVFLEAEEMRRESLKALALAVGPLIAVAAFGLMISTMTDHTGIAASLALGTYMILETAKGSMPDGRLYLFNNFVPSLIDRSYFDVLRKLADGFLDEPWEEHVIGYGIATPLVSAAIFVVIASIIFGRRNFVL